MEQKHIASSEDMSMRTLAIIVLIIKG